jgi:biotin carboxyl carrier protein
VLAATAAVLVLVVALRAALAPKPPPAAPAPAPKLTARGQVRPVAQARVGTLSGGVVASLAAAAGDAVDEQQELARVRGAGVVEVLTAPRRGTVTSVPVGVGDTVTPGTTVAVVADLSRLQVETTDVDEFLVGRLRRGQPAALVVLALDGRELHGFVRSVALQPQTAGGRDAHYPVAIDLVDPPPDLRLGMEVRITFAD